MYLKDLLMGLSHNICYSPKLARHLKSVNAAILYSYFCSCEMDDNDWIYKTQEEIYEETSLQRRGQENARKILKETGILEEKYDRLSHKFYYRCLPFKMEE